VVRGVDVTAALSPYEFGICLVHCGREGAERALARMLSELAGYRCQAGIAVFPEEPCEPAALIELARGRALAGELSGAAEPEVSDAAHLA
jgi:hypothetical protein